ncbi:DNRLRE domain-containing protein [Streptomyces sp. NPDC052023]|uniref:DNRLRE domain-containing protein n=1 Tax=Streptomyces sp. NPDC052023 TaxID=3365681 RepID=UPI0037CF9B84
MDRHGFGSFWRRSSTGQRLSATGIAALLAAALGIGLLGPGADGQRGGPNAQTDARPKTRTAPAPLDEDAAQEKAVTSGQRVEVAALRSETSTTYARPDGSFELVTYGAPVRAKVDGAWQPIDTTLRKVNGGWAPKAAADPVVFSDGSNEVEGGAVKPAVYTVTQSGRALEVADDSTAFNELATLTSAGHQVTLSWPGPVPQPVVNGSSALYRNVFPDVDLLLSAQDSGFTHVLIVHNAEAAADLALRRLTYGLSSPDLIFRLDPLSKVVTGENRKGEEITVSPTPYLWDSAGRRAVTEGGDPEPAEPNDDPSPSYSEEPGSGVGDEPEPEPLDTEGPTPTDEPQEKGPALTAPAADPSETASSDPRSPASFKRSRNSDTTPAIHTGAEAATPVAAPLTDDEIWTLPGLAGADPGTHIAVADAKLSDPGTDATTLSIVPDTDLLTDSDTVYPVFIDPTIYGKTRNWTTAYNRYPTSSFYDGANYNTGTTEARVGYEKTTWGTSRSFFRLGWDRDIEGATVLSASIRLRETYAWSCAAREMQLWHTGSISSKTTWSNQPSWLTEIGTKSFAHGYNSSCPDAYVSYDAKAIAEEATDNGWRSLTLGLRATDESSAYPWKKFKAEGDGSPRFNLVYNRKPAAPKALDQSPGNVSCDRTSPAQHIGKRDLVLSARSSDPDDTSVQQNLKYLHFQVWRSDNATTFLADERITVDSSGKASVKVSQSKFTNAKTYRWHVRAIDASGAASAWSPTTSPAYCHFLFDSDFPEDPDITSTDFPRMNDDGTVWSEVKFGTAGNFHFSPAGETDVVRFEFSFNTSSYGGSKTVTPGQSVTVPLKPHFAGPNVLYARSKDSAGNVSPGTKYMFYVTPRDKTDAHGDVTGDTYPDLFGIHSDGQLRTYPGNSAGDLASGLAAAHNNGTPLDIKKYANYWVGSDGKPALLTHDRDIQPGDGVTDLFARMPDGKLYVYRGDGYGGVDITKRTTVLLPPNGPDTATITQMIAGDMNLDDQPDLFLRTQGGGFWILSGYTGASFRTATHVASTTWAERDLVSVGDHNADGAPDLLFRSTTSDRLVLRYGIKDPVNGGSTIASFATSGGSLNGKDEIYAEGWNETTTPITHIRGTPDVNGDDIPDIWALAADGSIQLHVGGRLSIGATTVVVGASGEWGTNKLTFG